MAGGLTQRQAHIRRRQRIRALEAARDRAIDAKDKALQNLRKARADLSNARKER